MKKVLTAIFLTLILFIPSLAVSAANVQIKIDGNTISSDVAPKIVNNRTMVLLRVISENLGATVHWSNSIVTVKKSDVEVVLKINNEYVTKNGESIKLDTKPYLYNNRTMVPICFIAETFGSLVDYNNGVVTIITEPLIINNQVAKGLLRETQNVLGSTVYKLQEKSYIKDIYEIYIENIGDDVDAPHIAKYDFSNPGTYYKNIQHKFIDQDDKVIQHFEVYRLYDQLPNELLEGYPDYLLFDVTDNRWYEFNEDAAKSIEQLIQKANSNGLFELISTTL